MFLVTQCARVTRIINPHSSITRETTGSSRPTSLSIKLLASTGAHQARSIKCCLMYVAELGVNGSCRRSQRSPDAVWSCYNVELLDPTVHLLIATEMNAVNSTISWVGCESRRDI